MCDAQTQKKYTSRPSPSYPANECCGEVKTGNDGRMYKSERNVKGICAWKLHKSSKSPKKSTSPKRSPKSKPTKRLSKTNTRSNTRSPKSSRGNKITQCMKKYIDLDEDKGTWKTASKEVLEIARDFCKNEGSWFDQDD